MSLFSILDRSHTVAKPGFSRWMVPPAALCVHLCIGQAYAFSVFNLPMTKLLGITKSVPGDWTKPELGCIFSLAILFLGLSAAVFGRWLAWVGAVAAVIVVVASAALVGVLAIHAMLVWALATSVAMWRGAHQGASPGRSSGERA